MKIKKRPKLFSNMQFSVYSMRISVTLFFCVNLREPSFFTRISMEKTRWSISAKPNTLIKKSALPFLRKSAWASFFTLIYTEKPRWSIGAYALLFIPKICAHFSARISVTNFFRWSTRKKTADQLIQNQAFNWKFRVFLSLFKGQNYWPSGVLN